MRSLRLSACPYRLDDRGHLLPRFRLMPTYRLRGIFFHSAYADVIRSVGAFIAKARHNILATLTAAFLPLSADLPECPPTLKCEQELNAALSRSPALFVESNPLRVVQFPLELRLPHLLAVSRSPLALILAVPFSAIVWVSHWFLLLRTVVRDGRGAQTPLPSRLYHALPHGAR
jgi:hypothetical protein